MAQSDRWDSNKKARPIDREVAVSSLQRSLQNARDAAAVLALAAAHLPHFLPAQAATALHRLARLGVRSPGPDVESPQFEALCRHAGEQTAGRTAWRAVPRRGADSWRALPALAQSATRASSTPGN